jgi:hypothetical protein
MIPTGEIPLWPDHPSEEDLLGFADIAAPIGAAIRRERLDPVAIGVFGDWGSGKTTVLQLVGKQFDAGTSASGDAAAVLVICYPAFTQGVLPATRACSTQPTRRPLRRSSA